MKTLLPLFLLTALSAAAAPFEISVVPAANQDGKPHITWADDSKHIFYVVMRNTSTEPQKIFETWNSWGYQAITFDITPTGGESATASVKPQIFTVNYASTFTIPPSGYHVFPIRFDSKWTGLPNVQHPSTFPATITARYTLAESPESKKQQVWTGTVKSQPLAVQLNHR